MKILITLTNDQYKVKNRAVALTSQEVITPTSLLQKNEQNVQTRSLREYGNIQFFPHESDSD